MTTFIDKVYKKCLHLNYKVYEINILDKGDHMSKIVEVINDIMSSIDPKAGPVLTEVDGQGKVSIDITNSVLSNVLDVTLPSNDTNNNDNFDEDSKVLYSTDPSYQRFQTPRDIKKYFSMFNFMREFAPMGKIINTKGEVM